MQSYTLFLKSYFLLAYTTLLSYLQLFLCMIFPSSMMSSPPPSASQETYSFFFSLPSYFQSQPLFFIQDPQLCLHSRLIFPSTLDLGMPFQCFCCTPYESAETSTRLKAQLLILFVPKSGLSSFLRTCSGVSHRGSILLSVQCLHGYALCNLPILFQLVFSTVVHISCSSRHFTDGILSS